MDNNNKLLEEIKNLNSKNWDFLNFGELLKKNKKAIYKKIVFKHLFPKYKRFFLDENNQLDNKKIDDYFDEVYLVLNKNFGKNSSLDSEKLLKIYKAIYSFVGNVDGYRNKNNVNIQAKKTSHKKYLHYCHSKDILKELNVALIKFNNTKNFDIKNIYDFYIDKAILRIHPFEDNNFGFFSILIDLEFLNNNYLPIAFKIYIKNSIFKDKLFSYELFIDFIYHIYKSYKY